MRNKKDQKNAPEEPNMYQKVSIPEEYYLAIGIIFFYISTYLL
ncbi:hypothetical protein [Elizabethkingia bruuniana]|nr:hypothetical protein [Elizabethkingia bruuniana]